MGWVENLVCMKDRVLMEKPAGRTPLGRPWFRLENNIKMDL
jgi:hypothetical protein